MSSGEYWLGMAELIAFAAAVGFSAIRLRQRFLPGWSGAPARLAESIVALSLAVVIGQVLGAVGLFFELPLLFAAAGVAVGCHRLEPGASGARPVQEPAFPSRLVALGVALATAVFVLVVWLPDTTHSFDVGIDGFDSMWYHLPAAARFAQTGSLTGLHFYGPVETHWFFPGNSDLLHAIGIAILDRDAVSPLINLGWIGIALLAAWCVGRPYGVQAATTLAVAAILVSSLVVGQAGRPKPDVATVALFVAAAALLINGAAARPRSASLPTSAASIAVAGLAAGLAVGMRFNAIPAAAVIGLGLMALAGSTRWRLAAVAWFGPLLGTCGFWYVRNLFAAGNPVPQAEIGVGPLALPTTDRLDLYRPDSVADLITDGDVWRDHFVPGLEFVFDGFWFLVIGFALVGMIGAAVSREHPVRGVIAAAALVGTIAYVLTPYTATGSGPTPNHFALNLRWAMPVLAIGLALMPTIPALRSTPMSRLAVGAAMGVVLIVTFDATRLNDHQHRDTALLVAGLITATAGGLVILRRYGGFSRLELAGCAVAIAAVAVAGFWPVTRDYLRDRYTDVWPGVNVSASFRWAAGVENERVALSGTTASFFQYGYYGRDLSNEVEYVAHHGPRGAFSPIETCAEWRQAVNDGGYDYLVTSGTLDILDVQSPGYAPEPDWIAQDPAAPVVLRDGPVTVHRIVGQLDPDRCDQIRPLFTGLPPLLREAAAE